MSTECIGILIVGGMTYAVWKSRCPACLRFFARSTVGKETVEGTGLFRLKRVRFTYQCRYCAHRLELPERERRPAEGLASNDEGKRKAFKRVLTAVKVLGILIALGGGVPAFLSAAGLMLDIFFLALPWVAPDLGIDASRSFNTTVIGSAIGMLGVMLVLAAWRLEQADGDG